MKCNKTASPASPKRVFTGTPCRSRLASVGFVLGLISGFLPVLAGTTTSLLNESFDQAATQPEWHFSRGGEFVSNAAGSTAFNTQSGDNSFHYILNYFTAPGRKIVLGVGDSLSIAVKFSLVPLATGSGESPLRFGLYDSSAGKRATATAKGSYANYTGYSLYLDTKRITKNSVAQPPVALYRRKGGNSALGNTETAHALIGRNGSWGGATSFAGSTPYQVSITLTRASVSTMNIELGVTGGGLSGYSATWTEVATTSESVDYAKFDTFAIIFSNGRTFERFILDNVSIARTSALPSEPK